MTAAQAASEMAAGIRAALPAASVAELPIADGGEGFTEAVAAAMQAQLHTADVHDQRGELHTTNFAIASEQAGQVAILDVASTSGVERIPVADRDVMHYDSRGLGELISIALDAGVSRLVIGIGGSSTNEGGAGMLTALGVRLLDDDGLPVPPTPAGLQRLASVDVSGLDPRLSAVEIEVACDVTNPLLGPEGASAVYGPQKGATTPELVAELDAILGHFATVCGAAAEQAAELPGSGAAGGLGWALRYFLGANLRPGFELVANLVELDEHLAKADLLLTAEGSVDEQTPHGKAIQRICEHGAAAGVPVLVFGGRVSLEAGKLPGEVIELVTITPPGQPLDQALAAGPANLRRAVTDAVQRWHSGR